MEKKTIGSAISLILVVGVTIGIVVLNDDKKGVTNEELNTHSKTVDALCQNTDDNKLCHETLYPVEAKAPSDYVKTVMKHSMNSLIKAFNMSDKLNVENNNNSVGIKMALEDCKDLLEFAIDELKASNIVFSDKNKNDVAAELKNWLGAVIAYAQSCLDGFNTDGEKKVQSQLQTGSLDNVEKLTALALDVVTGISEMLASLNLTLNVKPTSRRLLNDLDKDGYPIWVSIKDRKLLANRDLVVKPNAVVAKDGSGQFKNVLDAINAYPKKHKGRYIIYVKAGTYDEYIIVDKKKTNILLYGDGPTKTIITGSKNFKDGVKTLRTATFSTQAENFIAKSIAFENTAGPEGHQAVALRVQGDRSTFFDCAMHGYQDTLYAHAHRQFYRNCEISGTVDFIFGYSTTLIQNSKIIVRKPGPNQQNIVVADGTVQKNMPTGVVLQNCEIVPEKSLIPDRLNVKSYLARPWKAYSRAIFIENTIGDFIQPDGFLPWQGNQFLNTCYFAEYGNNGVGANAKNRVKWGRGVLQKNVAAQYTAEQWLQADTWLPTTGIPYQTGFTRA
ncbi:hypothetical protein TanjilG_02681 [Lupinus angustifolius]|uniref:Pectinesterase n=1 Tax=Lupinus angustifolius TaxID=3871 RepID=A0A4P1RBQ5_LUPAN|nr:PREDICTED: pectinesterase-like [Lupinus angustifolius]OIW07047.1 hypothetical protein TanjilG_02681 [Lupinus angustifolius]